MLLPDNWELKTIEDVCLPPQYGWTTSASTSGNLHLLRTTDITHGSIDWDTVPYCTQEPGDADKYLLKDGDVVISRAGSVGVSHLVRNPKRAIFASYLIRFRPLINANYFSYFLQSPMYWQAISENRLGIAIPNVNATKLKQINIPVPALPEQEHIVERIESLFTQLDAGVAGLKRAQAALKRYRASVLKVACEGSLTYLGISDENQSYKNWQWVKWSDLISFAQNGFGKRRSDNGTPTIVLRLADISNNKISLTDVRRISASEEEIKKYQLVKNDIICIRVNGSLENVGRFVVFTYANEAITYCDHFIRYRLHEPEMAPFYSLYFDTDRARKFIEQNRVSSAGQNTISQGTLANFEVPLPPLIEQKRIIAEVERRFSVIQELEQSVSASLKRAARLRQAILKQAFEGRLVDGSNTTAPIETDEFSSPSNQASQLSMFN